MRRRHFETLRPVCPACRTARGADAPLTISLALREDGDHLVEGVLQCTDTSCLAEYPIVDGIPMLFPDTRSYLAENAVAITAREDLSEEIESLLGECSGPGSFQDATRQHLSSYTWDHWGEFDPEERGADPAPGSVARVLARARTLIREPLPGPALDVGCAVGRSSLELARARDGLVLGVDRNFSMLRLAARMLRTGRVSYDRRRVGMVYERRDFPVPDDAASRVDFWACDATALPFPDGSFAEATGLNVLDAVHAPLALLGSLARVLRSGGSLCLATPYDWSGAVTPAEAWIGGHSVRAPGSGSSENVLRALLTQGGHPVAVEGLELCGELDDVPWRVRMHDRSSVSYRVHIVACVCKRIPGARST